jgi:hypothetical protein
LARLSITLTEKAHEIYKAIKSHERSKFVSDAIISKWRSGTGLEARVERLEREVEWIKKVILDE